MVRSDSEGASKPRALLSVIIILLLGAVGVFGYFHVSYLNSNETKSLQQELLETARNLVEVGDEDAIVGSSWWPSTCTARRESALCVTDDCPDYSFTVNCPLNSTPLPFMQVIFDVAIYEDNVRVDIKEQANHRE